MAQHHALKFISGKYQGGEFPLLPDREIVVGRSSDLDMVLVEDMVSRKHAKIATMGGQIVIQDLGSTNGTFVNGEKIRKTRLKPGDRILIGTSILKVIVTEDQPVTADEHVARANLEAMERSAASEETRGDMNGQLDEVPVPDLLQLFGTSKRTGVLNIRTGANTGRIHLRNGNVFYASVNEDHELGPMKALCRMVGWAQGDFQFEQGEQEEDFVLELEDTTENLLGQATRHLDEFRKLERQLPRANQTLSIPRPLAAPLSSLAPNESEVFQTVFNFNKVQEVLDRSPLTDHETAEALLSLISQGFVKAG